MVRRNIKCKFYIIDFLDNGTITYISYILLLLSKCQFHERRMQIQCNNSPPPPPVSVVDTGIASGRTDGAVTAETDVKLGIRRPRRELSCANWVWMGEAQVRTAITKGIKLCSQHEPYYSLIKYIGAPNLHLNGHINLHELFFAFRCFSSSGFFSRVSSWTIESVF